MRSVIVAGLLIAVAGCAHPVKTTHVSDPAYAQTHTTPGSCGQPIHGPGRVTYEVCLYAFAQSRCLALAEPSRQRCLASLTDPSPPTPEEIRSTPVWSAPMPPSLTDTWPSPSLTDTWPSLADSITRDIEKADQDRRMDDMKRDMQQQLDELKAERDREHMRYLDSESDR
jgi:hypothetical protein